MTESTSDPKGPPRKPRLAAPDSISAKRARRMRIAKIVIAVVVGVGVGWRLVRFFLGS